MNMHTKIGASSIAIAAADAARPTWDEAYRAYRVAEAAEAEAMRQRPFSDEDSTRASLARYSALKALIFVPAPSLDALAIKLAIYAGDDGHEYADARLMQFHMMADGIRLAQELAASPELAKVAAAEHERAMGWLQLECLDENERAEQTEIVAITKGALKKVTTPRDRMPRRTDDEIVAWLRERQLVGPISPELIEAVRNDLEASDFERLIREVHSAGKMAQLCAAYDEAGLDDLAAGLRRIFPVASWDEKLAVFRAALDAESEGATLEDNGQLSRDDLNKLSEASDAALQAVFLYPAPTFAAVIEKIDLYVSQMCDARQFGYAISAIKRDIRRLNRPDVPAETCDPTTPFSGTLARYEALRVAFNASDPEDNSLEPAYTEAHGQLVDARPTSARDFVGKFRSLWIEGGNPGEDVVEMMLADAERLLAPATPAIDPAAAAWQSFADNLRLLAETDGENEREALADKMDVADLVLARPSTSLLGIAGKLRRVFQCTVAERWSDEVCLLPIGAERDERVNDACFVYQMLWSAIEDVERMALTNSAPIGGQTPSSPAWRDKLLRLCAASEAMVQAGEATDAMLKEEQQALDAIIEHPVETPMDLALKGLIYDYHCYADIEHEDGAGRRAFVRDALRVTGCSDIQRLHSVLAEYAGHGQEQLVHA